MPCGFFITQNVGMIKGQDTNRQAVGDNRGRCQIVQEDHFQMQLPNDS